MGLVDVLQEKIFRYTVSITAARGRGKSAAIGMATAAAIALGSSNVFVTAPSPENLPTFFEFVVKGLDVLGMRENQHFDIIQSNNPEFNKAVVRINVYKTHRQFVQYVLPADAEKVVG
jgi:N-acetyltransferase 10